MMKVLGIEVTQALSATSQGKDPSDLTAGRRRQDRACTYFYEQLSTIEETWQVLYEEVARYNHRQVHSTTGEIPSVRFRRSLEEGHSPFRPYVLPKPYTSPKDVFCWWEKRIANGYHKIALFGQVIEVPGISLREEIEIHWVPDPLRQAMEVRTDWVARRFTHTSIFPLAKRGVHF